MSESTPDSSDAGLPFFAQDGDDLGAAARTLHLCSDKEALLIVDVFTCKSERRYTLATASDAGSPGSPLPLIGRHARRTK